MALKKGNVIVIRGKKDLFHQAGMISEVKGIPYFFDKPLYYFQRKKKEYEIKEVMAIYFEEPPQVGDMITVKDMKAVFRKVKPKIDKDDKNNK